MRKPLIPVWQGWTVFGLVFLLAVTGMGQMPIFKRYYIADLPGLGWLADFHATHVLHYLAATGFLAFAAYYATRYFMDWRRDYALTLLGTGRVLMLTLLAATGFLRVLKNINGVHYDPTMTMLIDWTHLGFAMVLGLLALAAALRGARNYLKPRLQTVRR